MTKPTIKKLQRQWNQAMGKWTYRVEAVDPRDIDYPK
jgi:hypothetical protein